MHNVLSVVMFAYLLSLFRPSKFWQLLFCLFFFVCNSCKTVANKKSLFQVWCRHRDQQYNAMNAIVSSRHQSVHNATKQISHVSYIAFFSTLNWFYCLHHHKQSCLWSHCKHDRGNPLSHWDQNLSYILHYASLHRYADYVIEYMTT